MPWVFVSAKITLNCRHRYHEFCIRGWIIVGKKDTCPYCNEKVDLKSTFTTPWEKTSIVWANLLDMVRYLVVWNPIIIMVTQAILLAMGFTPGAPPCPSRFGLQRSAELARALRRAAAGPPRAHGGGGGGRRGGAHARAVAPGRNETSTHVCQL